MTTLILLNKPFQVLSQFTDSQGRPTLADFVTRPGFYPAGRLDYDSEGLLLLCDDGRLQQRIANPDAKLRKTYLVQVEGELSDGALQRLREGLTLKDGKTRPARARSIDEPLLWTRTPPIRHRPGSTTSWAEIGITEGRNRQVRRMLAAVGHPVLRLIRSAIGDWELNGLAPGTFREERIHLPRPAGPRSSHTRSSRRSRQKP